MPAQPMTCGVAIAEQSKNVPIPEVGPATVLVLSNDDDLHFGMSNTHFNARIPDPELWNLGARGLDIHKRGGRTAENTWEWLGKSFLPVYCCQCLAEADNRIHPT